MMSNYSNNSNVTSDSYSQVGGLAFFLVYISDYLPYVIIVSSGTVIGIIGNLIIMLTIIINKELHSVTYMLIFNLSLADIIISGFVDTFTTIGVFVGSAFFEEHTALCSFIAATCLIACSTSLLNIGFLAFNRYIHICHNSLYKKLFSTKLTLLYCVITWICGVLIDAPNFTGWGAHSYDNATLSCVWNRLAHQSYTMFFVISSIVIPCGAIFFCYMRVFIFSYKSKNKSKSSTSDTQSIRLAQGLFASFMLFTICWLPYGLIVIFDFENKLPRSAVMFSMTFAHLNSALNPILYAIFNSSFRRGYATLFNKICCTSIFTLPSNRISHLTERQTTNQIKTIA